VARAPTWPCSTLRTGSASGSDGPTCKRFVDDPQEAVQTADGLVAELMQSLASSFDEHKGRLESAWQSGDDPDTEELRQALQRYRSFFDRLLST
jgi:hypothetical protein